MQHKTFFRNLLLLCLSFALFACSDADKDDTSARSKDGIIRSYKELRGKEVGLVLGSVFDIRTNRFAAGINYVYFDDSPTAVQALLNEKIPALISDETLARFYMEKYKKELYIASVFLQAKYVFILQKNSPLTPKVNEVVKDLRASGFLDDMKKKWVSTKQEDIPLEVYRHKKDYTGKNGVLTLGADLGMAPMTYLNSSHKPIGLDIDIANRIAYELDMKLEISSMKFAATVPSLSSGKIDMACGGISITDERRNVFDLTEPHFFMAISALAKYPQDPNVEPLSSTERELILARAGRAGVIAGSEGEAILDKDLDNQNRFYYDSFSDGVAAVRLKKMDFVIGSYASLQPFEQANEDLRILPTSLRKEGQDESDENAQVLIVHQDTFNEIFNAAGIPAAKEDGFWAGLKNSFEVTFINEDRYKLIIRGLGITLLISFATGAFGIVLAFLLCIVRCSPRPILHTPAKIYIVAMRGTPMVVVLMIFYYLVFANVEINAIVVAIVAFSLNYAASGAEIMRRGVNAIDKGQLEAAYVMGYNKIQVFKNIIFPQAARHSLPSLQGEFISTVKMTSVVGFIAIQDLTRINDIIRCKTFEAFFPLISTAVIYFILAHILTSILHYIEVKMDPKSRKRSIGKVVLK